MRAAEGRWEIPSFLQELAWWGNGYFLACTPALWWLAICGFITGTYQERAFFFLSEKKHSFFFFFFPSVLPSDLMFLLSFRFLKIGTATLLWLPVQLWSSFFFSLMQFGFTIRFDKTPSLLAPNAPSWKVVVGGHDSLCVVRNSLRTGKKINLGDLSWKRVEVLTLVCLGWGFFCVLQF